MSEDRAISVISMDPVGPSDPDEIQSLPRLSTEQALYISYLFDHPENAEANYTELQGEGPLLEEWMQDPEFREAMRLLTADRRTLWKAMTASLFGRAFRSLMVLISDPKNAKAAISAITLLSRTHGTLIDRVKHEEPGQVQALLRALSEYKPIAPPNAHYNIVEGEFTDAKTLPTARNSVPRTDS